MPDKSKLRRLELAEIQKIELHMFKYFDRFCRKHGLRYSMAGGTLLGAVRHKGFIPWDDDIDIGMPRPDYDRFCALMRRKRLDGGNIVLMPEHHRKAVMPYAKLFDRRTYTDFTYATDAGADCLWIDILPVDGMPGDPKELKRHFDRFRRLRFMLQLSRAKMGFGTTKWKAALKPLTKPFFKLFPTRFWRDRMDAQARKYDFDECDHVGIAVWGLYGVGESVRKNPACMEMKFEGGNFLGTVAYDEYLRGIYGDYMTMPPKEKQVAHPVEAYLREGVSMEEFW
ncbi:MAG: LicD family protein [Lachnospiraceae bacterium]|nr:LicD family protein [Lachnospiraceae bacterium]